MRPASTIQTLLRSYLVQSHSVNAVGVQPADFVIEPNVTAFELSAFGRTGELAAVGETATRAAAPQLLSLLAGLDSGLFPASAQAAPDDESLPGCKPGVQSAPIADRTATS
jgi:hypothetical protein